MNGRLLAVAAVSAISLSGYAVAAGGTAGQHGQLHSREAFVMGTRVALEAAAPSRAEGLILLERMLAVIERTEAELSTWRTDSAVSLLNAGAGQGPQQLTPDMCRLFGRLDTLVAKTGGAFDPAIGALTRAWDLHGPGRVPSDSELASARARSGWRLLSLDVANCRMGMPAGTTFDVGAFGKGEALDRVRAAMGHGERWLVDLGGQVAVEGARPGAAGWPVALAHPHDRAMPAVSLRLTGGSLATSAGSERDRRVNGRRVPHILDPRTGRAGAFTGSVSVWSASALAADAWSTALYVMGPGEGLRWADARGVAALFLETDAGGGLRQRPSRAFMRMFGGAAPPASDSPGGTDASATNGR